MKALDRILNVYSLGLLNVGIVIAAEFVGSGTFFFQTGIIHILAIGFVFLAFSTLHRRYYVADPILQKTFLRGAILSFVLFSCSHVIEFVVFKTRGEYHDVLWATIINFYLLSFCALVIGVEFFLMQIKQGARARRLFFYGLVIVFFVLTIGYMTNTIGISLELDGFQPYVYAGVTLLISAFTFRHVKKIGRTIPVLRSFTNALNPVLVLIVIATFVSILYELHDTIHVAEYHFVYISHFAFYASLSAMYLAFRTLEHLPGVPGELKEIVELKKQPLL